ncbi:MAG: hypothetical protein WBL85_04820 [Sedimentisphaerales bacterium]
MSEPKKRIEERGFVPPKPPTKPGGAETGYVPPNPPRPPTKQSDTKK